MSKILIGVDGSNYVDKAFEYAISLAQRFDGTELLIVNILEVFATVGHSISQELESERSEMLRKYQEKARSRGVKFVHVIEDRGNSAAEKILQIALKESVDTIVIGSRGKYFTAEEFILGSTSYKLAHHAKCTVILVR